MSDPEGKWLINENDVEVVSLLQKTIIFSYEGLSAGDAVNATCCCRIMSG